MLAGVGVEIWRFSTNANSMLSSVRVQFISQNVVDGVAHCVAHPITDAAVQGSSVAISDSGK